MGAMGVNGTLKDYCNLKLDNLENYKSQGHNEHFYENV